MEATGLEGKIVGILTPLFGTMMAEGTVKLSCTSLNADPHQLSIEQLEAVARDIEKRMIIFLGTEKAQAVGRQIAALKA
jgi:hypothetical protein